MGVVLRKRVVLVVLSLALAVSSLAVLTGCQDDTKIIRDALVEELEGLKSADPTVNKTLVDELDGLKDLNVDPAAFLKSWLTGFDYNIKEIKKIDASKATATVEITVKQLGPAIDSFVNNLESNTISSMDEAGDLLLKTIEKQGLKTSEVVVTYELKGNIWTPVDDSTIIDVFLGESENL